MTYYTKIYDRVRAEFSVFAPEGGLRETHVVLHLSDGLLTFDEQLGALMAAREQVCGEECEGAKPVFERLFVSDAANQCSRIAKEWIDGKESAVSVVEQPPLDGTKVALWMWFMGDVQRRRIGGGELYEVRQGAYRHLFGSGQHCLAESSEEEARSLLSAYAERLHEEKLTLEEACVRTWFFVQNVDVNYGGLVRARNEVFAQHGMTKDTHYVASTGIGGRHEDARVRVLMDSYAISGLRPEQKRYLYAASHLNRTSDYGVAFERGTMIDYADHRQVFISGTASIDNRGEVLFAGDIRRQMMRMVENVEALLCEADCSMSDVQQAIIYLRDISDRSVVEGWFAEHYPMLPRVFTYARVCRPGWLIEMECMAAKEVR